MGMKKFTRDERKSVGMRGNPWGPEKIHEGERKYEGMREKIREDERENL